MKHLLPLILFSIEDYYLSRIDQEFQRIALEDGIDDAMNTINKMMTKTKIEMENEEPPKVRRFVKIKEK